MEYAQPLPTYLVENYRSWKGTGYSNDQRLFQTLMAEGQKPPAMIISCCDSRVDPISIFGAKAGDAFIHRNIANFVPPYDPEGDSHGTSAAVEYAVTALKVSHLVVMGHSACGGVAGCHAKCSGDAPALEAKDSFVGRWVEFLRPGYERVTERGVPAEDQLRAMEQESVVVSLENLMRFPFVSEAVANGDLTLHGLWIDIAE